MNGIVYFENHTFIESLHDNSSVKSCMEAAKLVV